MHRLLEVIDRLSKVIEKMVSKLLQRTVLRTFDLMEHTKTFKQIKTT